MLSIASGLAMVDPKKYLREITPATVEKNQMNLTGEYKNVIYYRPTIEIEIIILFKKSKQNSFDF